MACYGNVWHLLRYFPMMFDGSCSIMLCWRSFCRVLNFLYICFFISSIGWLVNQFRINRFLCVVRIVRLLLTKCNSNIFVQYLVFLLCVWRRSCDWIIFAWLIDWLILVIAPFRQTHQPYICMSVCYIVCSLFSCLSVWMFGCFRFSVHFSLRLLINEKNI